MVKAILELEMPESCAECLCKSTDVWGIRCRLIHIKSDKYSGMAEGYVYKRRPDCPLKQVEKEGLEWIGTQEYGQLYYPLFCYLY